VASGPSDKSRGVAKEWLDASLHLTAVLRAPRDDFDLPDYLMGFAVLRARVMADADAAALAVPDDTDRATLAIRAADGLDADRILDRRVPVDESGLGSSAVGVVYRTGQHRTARLFGDRSPGGPTLLVPLGLPGAVHGVLILGRVSGRPAFEPWLERPMTTFAAQLGVALVAARDRTGRPSLRPVT
jgi:GAF domain-containing protein